MDTLAIISALALITGVMMAFGNFPQAYKIFKRKSAGDVSLITYLIFFVGSVTWLAYGIASNDVPIIASYSVGTLSTALVIAGWFKYKGK